MSYILVRKAEKVHLSTDSIPINTQYICLGKVTAMINSLALRIERMMDEDMGHVQIPHTTQAHTAEAHATHVHTAEAHATPLKDSHNNPLGIL